MTYRIIFTLIVASIILLGCDNDEITNTSYNIKGNVQKGPFSNGSELNIYELDEKLSPTGRTFRTSINDLGKFELSNTLLSSPYVELVANGYYYNEINGQLSNSPLTLRAIVCLSDVSTVNINLLTNLEFERVKQLVITEGKPFATAKTKAQNEILTIFSFTSNTIYQSEALDISETTDGDATLLAISAIVQGSNSTAEMSKLLSDIVTDMKTDGTLDDITLQNKLFTQASLLNAEDIKQNIKKIYKDFGIVLDQLSNFDEKISYFITHSAYQFVSSFDFPNSTSFGPNILSPNTQVFKDAEYYSLGVNMPSNGKITIKIKVTEGTGDFYNTAKTYGWQFEHSSDGGTFKSTLTGEQIKAQILFEGCGIAVIEIYYDNKSEPSITKTITWGGYIGTDFYFPDNSPVGYNLLTFKDSTGISNDTTYVIGVALATEFDLNFTLSFPTNVSVEIFDGLQYTYNLFNNRIEFNLKGVGPSEIGLKFKGEGTLNLTSDLQFKNGTYLSRTYFLKKN